MNKKNIQVLSYRVTDDFLKDNNFNVYNVKGEYKEVIEQVIDFYTITQKKEWEEIKADWKLASLTNIPYKINSLSPYRVFISNINYNEILLYIDKNLSEVEIEKIKWMMTTSLSDFITGKYSDDLKKYLELNNFKTSDFSIEFEYKCAATIDMLKNQENFSLIKMLFIKQFLNKKVLLGDCEEALEEAKEIQFYPSYNGKHELVSQIIEAYNDMDELKRYAVFIAPKIEVRNEEIYINIIIGTKVILDSLNHQIGSRNLKDVIVNGKNDNSSLYYFDDEKYIVFKLNTYDNNLKLKWEDKKLLEVLEQTNGITYNNFLDFLKDTSSRKDMFLLHNQYRGLKESNLASDGLHNKDKLAISKFIVENFSGLEIMPQMHEHKIVYPSEIKKNAKKGCKLDLYMASYKGKYSELNLYVVRKKESNIIEMISNLFNLKDDKERLFDNYETVEMIKEKTYRIVFSDGIFININIVDICCEEILKDSYKDETVEDRVRIIQNEIGNVTFGNSVFLIELEKTRVGDAKEILRQAFIKLGYMNQFIIPSTLNYNTLRQRLLMLFQCFGFCNSVAFLGGKVVYTYKMVRSTSSKTLILPFIIRVTESCVEVAPVIKSQPIKFIEINDIYKEFYTLRDFLINDKNEFDETVELLFNKLQEALEKDTREKILIHEDKFKMPFTDLVELVNNKADNVVDVGIKDIEVIVSKAGSEDITFAPVLFSFDEDTYISIGDKTQSQRYSLVYGSKFVSFVKRPKKSEPKEKVINGAFGTYQDRRAFMIRIVKNRIDKAELASLIKLSRYRLTSEIHCNETSYSNYLSYFSKYI